MATYHFWRRLLDEEGRPIEDASVTVYLERSTTLANIYDGSEIVLSNPITTDSTGKFDFYIRDYSESNGYAATQKFKLSWTGFDQDGTAILGEIDRINIFPNLFQVDETSGINTSFNKMASNDLAYDWDSHILEMHLDEVHDMQQVDEYDSVDMTPNKLISNYFMNQLWSQLGSASTPSIESTGAVVSTINVGLSGSGDPVKWIPSGTSYCADIDHSLNIQHPIVVLYESSGAEYQAYNVESIDKTPPYNIVRVFSKLNVETEVTVIG